MPTWIQDYQDALNGGADLNATPGWTKQRAMITSAGGQAIFYGGDIGSGAAVYSRAAPAGDRKLEMGQGQAGGGIYITGGYVVGSYSASAFTGVAMHHGGGNAFLRKIVADSVVQQISATYTTAANETMAIEWIASTGTFQMYRNGAALGAPLVDPGVTGDLWGLHGAGAASYFLKAPLTFLKASASGSGREATNALLLP